MDLTGPWWTLENEFADVYQGFPSQQALVSWEMLGNDSTDTDIYQGQLNPWAFGNGFTEVYQGPQTLWTLVDLGKYFQMGLGTSWILVDLEICKLD